MLAYKLNNVCLNLTNCCVHACCYELDTSYKGRYTTGIIMTQNRIKHLCPLHNTLLHVGIHVSIPNQLDLFQRY